MAHPSSSLPAPRSVGVSAADLGLLVIRLVLAAVFIFHGAQKLFGAFGGPGMNGFIDSITALKIPVPQVSAWISALTEFVGGIIMVVGTGARIAAIFLCINMIVAIVKVHNTAFSGPGGMEYPLTLACVFLGIALIGPGRITLDRLLSGRS